MLLPGCYMDAFDNCDQNPTGFQLGFSKLQRESRRLSILYDLYPTVAFLCSYVTFIVSQGPKAIGTYTMFAILPGHIIVIPNGFKIIIK